MDADQYDVVIVGGAFSGASAGLLIKRKNPRARILIVERSVVFDRKVGESTSEVAGCFLTRVLGLASYMGREHIAKQGLRLWFADDKECAFDECTEIGPHAQVRLPAYQIDRSKLDEHILELAVKAGCELCRPARVREIRGGEFGDRSADGSGHELEIESEQGFRRVVASWVVDASGRAAWLGRKRGDIQVLEQQPIKSMWGRFKGVADLDGADMRSRFPEWAGRVNCSRSAATNHLTGRGWWCWIIPLQDGDVSLGLTYDPRLFTPPEGDSIAERLLRHVRAHPVGKELFAGAEAVERDTRAYGQLPYKVSKVAAEGWITVGDAAGFMDPLYSQGLDYCAHTVFQAVGVINSGMGDRPDETRRLIDRYNRQFNQSYGRWFDALYLGKYHYLGDAELMWAAFQLDLGAYFLGPVKFVYGNTDAEFSKMPYDGVVGGWIAKFMGFYNQRLALIADKRWHAGRHGRWNRGRKLLVRGGFAPTPSVAGKFFLRGLWRWGMAELSVLGLRRPPVAAPAPAEPVEAPAKVALGAPTTVKGMASVNGTATSNPE